MKYSINGYSQERLVKNELDLIDSLILRVLSDIYSSNSKKIDYKIIKNDKYMWISYGYLFEQVPIVGSERTLIRKIDKLIEKKMLKKELITSKKGVKGRYLYISFGENYLELTEYVQKEEEKSEKEERTKCQNDMDQMTNCHGPNAKMSSHQMTNCHDKDPSIIYSSINNKLKEKNKKERNEIDDYINAVQKSEEYKNLLFEFVKYRKKIKLSLKTPGPLKTLINFFPTEELLKEALEYMDMYNWRTAEPQWIENKKQGGNNNGGKHAGYSKTNGKHSEKPDYSTGFEDWN